MFNQARSPANNGSCRVCLDQRNPLTLTPKRMVLNRLISAAHRRLSPGRQKATGTLEGAPPHPGPQALHVPSGWLIGLALGLWAGSLGCQSLPPLSAVDTTQPGWVVRQGQASWRSHAKADELVGELVVATHPTDGWLLQFSKTPLPILAAQSDGSRWELRRIPEQRAVQGRLPPPPTTIWLHLAPALNGSLPPSPLEYRQSDPEHASLSNPVTGEHLAVYLHP